MTSSGLLEIYKEKLKELYLLKEKIMKTESNNTEMVIYINGKKASQADIRHLVKDMARGLDVTRHETDKGAIAFVTNY